MQPPKVKVVAVAVAITMVDLKIRAIPLSWKHNLQSSEGQMSP
jgi:hypothetical protein